MYIYIYMFYIPWLSRVLLFLRLGFCPFFLAFSTKKSSHQVKNAIANSSDWVWYQWKDSTSNMIRKMMDLDDGICFICWNAGPSHPLPWLNAISFAFSIPIRAQLSLGCCRCCTTHTWYLSRVKGVVAEHLVEIQNSIKQYYVFVFCKFRKTEFLASPVITCVQTTA